MRSGLNQILSSKKSIMMQIFQPILVLFLCIEFIACSNTIKKDISIKSWILENQHQITLDTDSILKRLNDSNNLHVNWISFSIVNTIYADNSLASLAKKAGDSTMCIVIEISFYRDSVRKRRVMIAAQDSACLRKLQMIELNTDSTNDFVFGKLERPLY